MKFVVKLGKEFAWTDEARFASLRARQGRAKGEVGVGDRWSVERSKAESMPKDISSIVREISLQWNRNPKFRNSPYNGITMRRMLRSKYGSGAERLTASQIRTIGRRIRGGSNIQAGSRGW